MANESRVGAGDDFLLHQIAHPVNKTVSDNPSWFDRFYFNIQDPSGELMIVMGGGVYPNSEVADCYVCVATPSRQRNGRYAVPLYDRLVTSIGPLEWQIEEPLSKWNLKFFDDELGLEFNVDWHAVVDPYLVEPIEVDHSGGEPTAFSHYFQGGQYRGTIVLDGTPVAVDGWWGQRDRSWGIRRTRERLGMHLWIAANFESYSVGLNYNEDRDGKAVHLDGAVSHRHGGHTPIVGLRHSLPTSQVLEGVEQGAIQLDLADGRQLELTASQFGAGVHMAGAGYDGRHGRPVVSEEREVEFWKLDGDRLRSLQLRLVDRLCKFEAESERGTGIIELAMTRSKAYQYAPTILS